MMSEVQKTKDMSLADEGRRQIEQAEKELSYLMALRRKHHASQPFKDVNICCFLFLNARNAVFIETLADLGAKVRWHYPTFFNKILDQLAAAVGRDSASVFLLNSEDYGRDCFNLVDFGPSGGANFLIQEGIKAEQVYENTGMIPISAFINTSTRRNIFLHIRDGLEIDPKRYHNIKERLDGASAVISTLLKTFQTGKDYVGYSIESLRKIGTSIPELFGYGDTFIDNLTIVTGIVTTKKLVLVSGYGDVGKRCIDAFKEAGANVCVDKNDLDPLSFQVLEKLGIPAVYLDNVVSQADFFVTSTNRNRVIQVEHMKKMKNNAILCNMSNNAFEIDITGLQAYPGVKRTILNTEADRWVFPETNKGIIVVANGHRFMNLDSNPGFGEFCIANNNVLVLKELLEDRFEEEVDNLPQFDGKVQVSDCTVRVSDDDKGIITKEEKNDFDGEVDCLASVFGHLLLKLRLKLRKSKSNKVSSVGGIETE